MKFESESLVVENRKLVDENQGLSSANNRFKVSLEEKEHDLAMAQANLKQLTEMLEEKSQNSESVQQERLQNLTGKTLILCLFAFGRLQSSLPKALKPLFAHPPTFALQTLLKSVTKKPV
jgi:hypothetical protein